VPVHSGLEAVDAVCVQIELNKTCGREVGEKGPGGGIENGGELREGHRRSAAAEVERRTPLSRDLAERTSR